MTAPSMRSSKIFEELGAGEASGAPARAAKASDIAAATHNSRIQNAGEWERPEYRNQRKVILNGHYSKIA